MSPSITLPKHVAIIMDGNGRWAKSRSRPRFFGHVRGAARVREIIQGANDLGIKALTLFAFSTENWMRPLPEQEVLWKILRKFLTEEIEELNKNSIKLQIIGDITRLSPPLQDILNGAIEHLSKNKGMVVTLAISYGGRNEILSAAKKFAQDCMHGTQFPENLSEEAFSNYLSTKLLGEFSDVDLLIRTSGESRVSNFLLWQIAYAELVFSPVYWPDFSMDHLKEAIHWFSQRKRRFGKVDSAIPEAFR